MEERRYPASAERVGYLNEQMGGAAVTGSEAASVLRNTYMLLGATLAFSALTAMLSLDAARPNFLVILAGFYGLLFVTYKLANSAWGLLAVFALTGFMGYTLGPILGAFMGAGMGVLVANAFAMTALVFFGLSAYALITRKDFSFLSGFLVAGFFVLIGAMIAGFIFNIPGLHLAISAGFVLFSSAAILFETGNIVHGGQRNYILATVGLFVSIYNLFLSLLHLLTAFSGDE